MHDAGRLRDNSQKEMKFHSFLFFVFLRFFLSSVRIPCVMQRADKSSLSMNTERMIDVETYSFGVKTFDASVFLTDIYQVVRVSSRGSTEPNCFQLSGLLPHHAFLSRKTFNGISFFSRYSGPVLTLKHSLFSTKQPTLSGKLSLVRLPFVLFAPFSEHFDVEALSYRLQSNNFVTS